MSEHKKSKRTRGSTIELWRLQRLEDIRILETERNIILIDDIIYSTNKSNNWKCGVCNYIWQTSMGNIIHRGSGCKKCSSGKSEEMVRRIFETTRTLDILRYQHGRNLELDGYNDFLKLAFKYQGIQHFQISPIHHNPNTKKIKEMTDEDIIAYRKAKFNHQQERDIFKREQCKKNGIILIIVSYKEQKRLNYRNFHDVIMDSILIQAINSHWQTEEFRRQFVSKIDMNYTPNFKSISKVSKLTLQFAKELNQEGYVLKDPATTITHYRQVVIIICAGKNFCKIRHEYKTYIDNFRGKKRGRGRRCKFCHSARPEDFGTAFSDRIKNVVLMIGKRKRDKYFQYTCVICNEIYSDTVSNIKKALCPKSTHHICKRNRCVI